MAEVSDYLGRLRENLTDAGCSQESIQACVSLARAERTPELLRLLSRHRKTLLDAVHRGQKQIDCLDYLIYQIEKQHHETYRRNFTWKKH